MRSMDMNELGIISLVQTAIMFLGFFQFGLINGGYRIFALDKLDEQQIINNLLFSYFALIAGAVLLGWFVLVITNTTLAISNSVLIIALICGILTLIMNWLTNTLVGKRLIKDINKINLISSTASLAVLPSIMIWGIYGAIISLIAQPLLFVGITLISHKELRPTNWNFELKLVKYILNFGFIPYLAGIFTLINLQIERWSIAEILGIEALGKFYLVFLYTTLFVLIPTSVNTLFFPPSVLAYKKKQYKEFKSLLKKYMLVLVLYIITMLILTFFLLQYTIDYILPQHSANTIYVYYILPGLIAYILCDPINLILNSAVKLFPMLIAGIIAVLLNLILIIVASKLDNFNLNIMTYIKVIIYIVPFLYYYIYILVSHKKLFL